MDLHKTDHEFAQRFAYFAFDEVIEVVNKEKQRLNKKILWRWSNETENYC